MLRSCNATNFVGIVHFLPQIVKGIRLNYRFMLKIKQLLLCSCFFVELCVEGRRFSAFRGSYGERNRV